MATPHTIPAQRSLLQRYIPALKWLAHYRREDLPSDLVAGIVTAIMLIPQSMAYAQLAGLPPEIGLYASIAPLAIYALMGTSGQLSVGPVAITSLAVATGVGALAAPGSARYLALALLLSVMVGVIKLAMGLLRLGFLLNFISHPVLAGFVSAAAVIIAVGQFRHLFGFPIAGSRVHEQVGSLIAGLPNLNPTTFAIGALSVVLLLFFKYGLRRLLQRHTRLPPVAITLLVSGAPLVTVFLGILTTWFWRLDTTAGVAIVGHIPQGFAPLSLPEIGLADAQLLLPTALTIIFISVVESVAVAQSLASKKQQTIDANQELIALGLANIAAGFNSGYPVTGGFARSVVNYQAGATTGLASLITALVIGVIVVLFTPVFFFLPQAVLAATVIVAVLGLLNVREPWHIWKINRSDALAWGMTFVTVLALGIELGIMLGVTATALMLLWRVSRPHVAEVGRIADTTTYRNILRHPVRSYPDALVIRVDESLYFVNTKFLEDYIYSRVAERQGMRYVVLIASAINFIDSSALATMQNIVITLRNYGIQFHLAEVKGPVMDQLRRAHFDTLLGAHHFHETTHEAMLALGLEKSAFTMQQGQTRSGACSIRFPPNEPSSLQ